MTDLEQATELINSAERPVILAGQGILKSEASRLLLEFAVISFAMPKSVSSRSGSPASRVERMRKLEGLTSW